MLVAMCHPRARVASKMLLVSALVASAARVYDTDLSELEPGPDPAEEAGSPDLADTPEDKEWKDWATKNKKAEEDALLFEADEDMITSGAIDTAKMKMTAGDGEEKGFAVYPASWAPPPAPDAQVAKYPVALTPSEAKEKALSDALSDAGKGQILFVRHAESINNIIGGFFNILAGSHKRYRTEAEQVVGEGWVPATTTNGTATSIKIELGTCMSKMVASKVPGAVSNCDLSCSNRDSPLSCKGMQAADSLQITLTGRQLVKDYTNPVSPSKEAGAELKDVKAIYVSPMRRTITTALIVFGAYAKENKIKLFFAPLAHEEIKSESDLPSSRNDLEKFLRNVLVKLHLDPEHDSFAPLFKSLAVQAQDEKPEKPTFPECSELQSKSPHLEDGARAAGAELRQEQAEPWPARCYPRRGSTFVLETDKNKNFFEERMRMLNAWLVGESKKLESGNILVVSHSAAIRNILKLKNKPANLAMFKASARDLVLLQHSAEPETKDFRLRKTLGDSIPGYENDDEVPMLVYQDACPKLQNQTREKRMQDAVMHVPVNKKPMPISSFGRK